MFTMAMCTLKIWEENLSDLSTQTVTLNLFSAPSFLAMTVSGLELAHEQSCVVLTEDSSANSTGRTAGASDWAKRQIVHVFCTTDTRATFRLLSASRKMRLH